MGRRMKYVGPGVDTSTMSAVCFNCNITMERLDEDTFECPDCGGRFFYDDNINDWDFFDPNDGMWQGDTMSRPKVCTGCGSDMYPDCQYSCKLMNN